MKLSVSLPEEDVAFVDSFAENHHTSRSAVLHEAVLMLRQRDLADEYADAYAEWDENGDAIAWEGTVADGLAA
jgi:Arc/MetJ-type ribon-helix-helix transcriptional regulator